MAFQAAYGAAVAKLDWEGVKQDIRDLLTPAPSVENVWPADYGNYGPLLVRKTWHCSGSYRSSDGCVQPWPSVSCSLFVPPPCCVRCSLCAVEQRQYTTSRTTEGLKSPCVAIQRATAFALYRVARLSLILAMALACLSERTCLEPN